MGVLYIRRLAILSLVIIVCAGYPMRVAAQPWDYLFENLSWSQSLIGGSGEGLISNGGFAVESATGRQDSGFWDYLFTGLQWPDESFSTLGGLEGGE
ncbi:MAG: hypothetical protein V1876_03225 [Candidatus Peregrinibacteria bacterium]